MGVGIEFFILVSNTKMTDGTRTLRDLQFGSVQLLPCERALRCVAGRRRRSTPLGLGVYSPRRPSFSATVHPVVIVTIIDIFIEWPKQ